MLIVLIGISVVNSSGVFLLFDDQINMGISHDTCTTYENGVIGNYNFTIFQKDII